MDRPPSHIAAEVRNAALDALLNCTAEGIFGLDRLGRCTFCNASAARMLGYDSPADLIGQRMHSLIHAMREDGSPCIAAQCAMNRAFLTHRNTHDDTAYMWRRGGSAFPVEYWTAPVVEDGAVVGTVVSFIDVTERKASAHALQHQATHDSLTGLQNRATLHGAIRSAIDAAEGERGMAVALIDLDRFKEVNDTLGHSVGDQVLVRLAGRLRHAAGAHNTLVRLGGDEFAVVMGDIAHRCEAKDAALRLMRELTAPIDVVGVSLRIGASIGIALYPEHGDDSSELLRCADMAMYAAKREGGGYAFHEAHRDAPAAQRIALLAQIRDALRSGQLQLRLDPQIDLATGRTFVLEALVYWDHPVHGMLPPEQFFPLIDVGDVLRPLMFWMAEKAIEQCARLHAAGHEVTVSINTPARGLLDLALPERIRSLLHHYRLDPRYLEMEVPESAMQADAGRSLETLQRLSSAGIGIVIDNFGAGYVSLRDLTRLRVRTLKIHPAFVRAAANEVQESRTLIAATVAMARSLGATVVADGVVDSRMMERTAQLGCDRAQGEGIATPLATTQIERWLTDRGTRLAAEKDGI